MQDSKSKIRRIVDAGMTILLLFLMAYQVTGETAHEWIGMAMTLLVIVHQVLNRRWYGAVLKGKYSPCRALTTIINILLLAAFALTAFCGMAMSGHAVPFLYGMAPMTFVRPMHLSMSHWAFVLMGLHLGLHVPVMTAGMKLSGRAKTGAGIALTCAAGAGLFLFLKNGMPDYLFFRVVFAFLDYEKAAWLVLAENVLMLVFWAFAGTQAALFCRYQAQKKAARKTQEKVMQGKGMQGQDVRGQDIQVQGIHAQVTQANPLVPVIYLMAAVLLGLILHMGLSGRDAESSGGAGWSSPSGRVGPAAGDRSLAGGERDPVKRRHAGRNNSDTTFDPGIIVCMFVNGGQGAV